MLARIIYRGRLDIQRSTLTTLIHREFFVFQTICRGFVQDYLCLTGNAYSVVPLILTSCEFISLILAKNVLITRVLGCHESTFQDSQEFCKKKRLQAALH